MKEIFEAPELEVIRFEQGDVIATSGGNPPDVDEGGNEED